MEPFHCLAYVGMLILGVFMSRKGGTPKHG